MKPILFNTEMVRAILDGRKTVTRRVVKPDVINKMVIDRHGELVGSYDEEHPEWDCYPTIDDAPYHTGDILYVREAFCPYDKDHIIDGDKYAYRADATDFSEPLRKAYGYKWRPAIHMPKEAARIFLRVTDVRVERLHESGKGWCLEIEKEGICTPQDPILYISDDAFHDALRKEMEKVWDSTINPKDREKYGWASNPWVWVISFERIDKPEANT